MAKSWKTATVDNDNLEWLKAKAAELTDATGITHSVNDVITLIRQKDIQLVNAPTTP